MHTDIIGNMQTSMGTYKKLEVQTHTHKVHTDIHECIHTSMGAYRHLWMPRRDLISKSKLTTEDHLGINREIDSSEAIVYRGSIFGEYKVLFRAYIKDLSNRQYEVN